MPDTTVHRHTFGKAEHLCRLSEIERLFSAGSRSATVYPMRIVYRPVSVHPDETAVKVLISVAKRRLHHAVDRNRAKRQIREAYRLQKHIVGEALQEGHGLHIGLIWLGDRPLPTDKIHQAVGKLLGRVADNLYRQQCETADRGIESTETSAQ